jgi:hypothetical protein
MAGAEVFGARYFESVFHKLADSKWLSRKMDKDRVSELIRQLGYFLTSPIVRSFTSKMCTKGVTEFTRKAFQRNWESRCARYPRGTIRGSSHADASRDSVQIHIGLLISALPIEVYLQPIWDELMSLITGDQYLTEISEPCRLVSIDGQDIE